MTYHGPHAHWELALSEVLGSPRGGRDGSSALRNHEAIRENTQLSANECVTETQTLGRQRLGNQDGWGNSGAMSLEADSFELILGRRENMSS